MASEGIRNNSIQEKLSKSWGVTKKYIRDRIPLSFADLTVLSVYIFAIGFCNWVIERALFRQSMDLFYNLAIGFRPGLPGVHSVFVNYSVLIGGLIAGFFGYYFLSYFSKLKFFIYETVRRSWGKCFAVACVLAMITPYAFSQVCFLATIILLAICYFVLDTEKDEQHVVGSKSVNKNIVIGILIITVVVSMMQMASAWYPIRFVNDYIEIPGLIRLPKINEVAGEPATYLDKLSAIDCEKAFENNINKKINLRQDTFKHKATKLLEAVSKNDNVSKSKLVDSFIKNGMELSDEMASMVTCSTPLNNFQADHMMMPLKITSEWESKAGRTFYHHSYIMVPMAHLLKYGLSTPIPYLYGLGNTAFHAMLMMGKPLTITEYFSTFPIAQLTGLLVILAVVFYITRNLMAVPVTLAMMLIPYALMEYENLQLAPGFSPLRYAGLAIQIASVFCLFRGSSMVRAVLFVAAAVFSFVWNKEFAIIGFASQMLALILPQLKINSTKRFTLIAACLVLASVTYAALGDLSKGFLDTVHIGMFKISVFPMEWAALAETLFYVALFSIISIVLVRRFPDSERAPRFCMMPMMALLLLKFIYYKFAVHLLFVLGFILPMSMVFFDWKSQCNLPCRISLNTADRHKMSAFLACLVVAVCFVFATHYKNAAQRRDEMMIKPFKTFVWDGLGESFSTTTQADPIVSRMTALRAEMKPDDRVLFLSPFDHLMSFYANPKKYCGHFEYLTNLATYSLIDDVVTCAKTSPNILVVYDEAVEHKCPTSWRADYYDEDQCVVKKKLTLSLQDIMHDLKANLVLVNKAGPLSFYRHAPTAQVKPAAVEGRSRVSAP